MKNLLNLETFPVILNVIVAIIRQVIHCSLGMSRSYAEAKLNGHYGSALQLGHVDFYRKFLSSLQFKKISNINVNLNDLV